jgi:hypothetical protein
MSAARVTVAILESNESLAGMLLAAAPLIN